MYCEMAYDPVTGNLVTSLHLGTLARDDRKDDRALRQATFESFMAKPEAHARGGDKRFVDDIRTAMTSVDDADLDFAMHMALAHHRLEAAHRERRRKIIDDMMALFFGAGASGVTRVDASLERARALLQIVPDAMLADHARLYCSQLCSAAMILDGAQILDDKQAAKPLARRMRQQSALADPAALPAGVSTEHISMLTMAVTCITNLDEHRKAVDSLLKLLAQPWAGRFLTVMYGVWFSDMQKYKMLASDAVVAASLERLTGTTQSDEDIVAGHFQAARSRGQLQLVTIVGVTFDALRAGVDMGRCTKGALVAVERILEQRAHVDDQMRARYRAASAAKPAQKPAQVPAPKPSPQSQSQSKPQLPKPANDPDPVWAWPLDKLAEWIDGPVADNQAPTLDPATIARRVRAQRQRLQREARAAKNMPAQPAPSTTPTRPVVEAEAPDDAMSDVEVAAVLQDGLRRSADFFLEEVDEIRLRAKSVTGPSGASCAEALVTAASELKALKASHSPWDIAQARAVFARVEAATTHARQAAAAARSSKQLEARFAQKLQEALNKEPLIYGKRTGGRVDCPVSDADWGLVSNAYHQRWLPQRVEIECDGSKVRLASDQVLALYVTGSSHSGYAFDISVHLWRRRAESTAPPCVDPERSRVMDGANWFDTYIPCCVLHVPKAKR